MLIVRMFKDKQSIYFAATWVVNLIIILILPFVFKNNIVLGNMDVSIILAAITSSLITAIATLSIPYVIQKSGFKSAPNSTKSVLYFAVLVIILWVIKRFANVTGLGISNNLYLIFAAAILSVGNLAILSSFPKKTKSKTT